jgi:2',3'-cyclic-nucleotide 2'-phosphodiesterase (5'-nucleotidase family)
VNLAKAYGRLGGLDRTATLVKAIRAERGDDKVLFLDGGDTWQGSYTSLKTNGEDMVDCMKLLKPDAMTGHWEFTFGEDRVKKSSRTWATRSWLRTSMTMSGTSRCLKAPQCSSGAVSRLP